LGSRAALGQVDEAIDLALEALEIERLPLRNYDDLLNSRLRADVTVAEVSKPSPTAAFELGMLAAIDDPVVYLVKLDGRVPAIFRHVDSVVYEADESATRLGYRIARAIELRIAVAKSDAIKGSVVDAQDAKATGRDLIRRLNERKPEHTRIRRGGADAVDFEGTIVHVDQQKGYALVAAPQTRPAMLHVSNMPASVADAFRSGELVAGRVLRASIAQTETGGSTQLREPDVLVDDNNVAPDVRDLATMIRTADLVAAAAEGTDEGARAFAEELNSVRIMRNKLAHGEPISTEDVRTAIANAVRLLGVLATDAQGHRSGFPDA